MKTNFIAIQGDLLIAKVKAIPKKAKKRDGGVLVYGESTGHSHRVVDGEVYEDGDRLYLQVITPTRIIHEEHGDVPVDVGDYEIIRQKEYTRDKMTRLVVD